MSSRPKHPRGFSQAAKLVIDIATGEKPIAIPLQEERGKNPAASALDGSVALWRVNSRADGGRA